jgi:transposase
MRVLAAIGDITRFPSAKHLVGYAGLGASVHESGETHRGGHITKEGRSDLRGVMVEAAWVAVEHHAHWKAQFERLSARIGNEISHCGHRSQAAGVDLACAQPTRS